MEPELSRLKRAELLARLAELEKLIADQQARVTFMREIGCSAAVAGEMLKRLEKSRELHCAALSELPRSERGDRRACGDGLSARDSGPSRAADTS